MRRALVAVDRVLSSRWFPWALAVLAGVVAVASKHLVYPELSWNRDEPVYRWQAELLRDGQLTSTDGGYPAIFHPWLSAHHDGRFFTQYPLGWPSAILAGDLVGWPELTLIGACALAVAGTYVLALEVTGRRRIAGLAASLFLLSPIVAVQSGVFLTYLFGTGLGTLFVAGLLRGVRTASRRRLAVAGLLLGAIVTTRTFDAVVWAAAAGTFVVVVERERWRELLRLLPAFVLGALPLVVLQLVHNWWTTGSPTSFAITVADPLDVFGFGSRRLMPRLDAYEYTPGRAVVGSAKHLFFLPWFLVGTYLGVAAALYAAWRGRAERATRLLLVLCLAFPLAYLPFWGIHISSLTTRISGPIYYIPVYAPLCTLMALGIVHLVRRAPRATAVAVVASLVVTIPVAVGRLGLNRHLSRIQGEWSAIEDVEGEAIVVVSPSPYLLFLAPDAITRPDVPGRLTYVVDEDPSLVDYVDRADRPAFLARATVPAGDLAPSEATDRFRVEVVPMELVRGDAIELEVTVVAPRDGVAIVDVADGEAAIWAAPEQRVAAGETRTVSVTLGHDRAAAGPDGIVLRDGGVVIDVVVGVGSSAAEARRAPLSRYRFLADAGDGPVRALQPGRWYQPEEYALGKGELRWLDGVPDPLITVELRSDEVGADGP